MQSIKTYPVKSHYINWMTVQENNIIYNLVPGDDFFQNQVVIHEQSPQNVMLLNQ